MIILLLLKESGALTVYLREDWRAIVQGDDLEYVGDLVEDFRERAKSSPYALFQQVSTLTVGPLVTYAAGLETELKGMSDLAGAWGKMAGPR